MENLLGCKGREYTAKIYGDAVSGRIQVENDKVYLCQDVKNGADCKDKLGFKHSWGVDNGSPELLAYNDITDFSLTPPTAEAIEAYKDWQVGDEITNGKNNYVVIFRSGDFVVCKNWKNEASTNYTCVELYRHGYRLKVDPQEETPVELTMDQIAERFNIPVSNLKIKED